jgi:hypothetical protein
MENLFPERVTIYLAPFRGDETELGEFFQLLGRIAEIPADEGLRRLPGIVEEFMDLYCLAL